MRIWISLGLAALAACLLAVPANAANRLTPADRRAISAALDVFVNHAVKRQDVGAAYRVVDDQLKGGMRRKEWSRGDIGVYPYPARGQHHPWTLDYVEGNEVGVDLMLQPPRGSTKLGPIIFKVYVDHVRGRWLVDEFMPAATFAPLGASKTKVRALPDFSPQAGGDGSVPTGRGRVSSIYLLVPFALIGLLLLGLAAWGLTRKARYRPRRQALPPLSIRLDDARARPSHRP